MVAELGKRADLFSASYQLLALQGRDLSCRGSLLSSPLLLPRASQHLKQQECRVNFHFLFSSHFQTVFVFILDSRGESSESHFSEYFGEYI